MREIVSGGLHGIASSFAGTKLQKVTGDIPYLADRGEEVHKDIQSMVSCLQYLCHKEEDKVLPPYYETVMLQPGTLTPMHNEAHNRSYNMCLISSNTTIQFKVPGLGQAFSLSLNAGWNILNMPNGTDWGLPSNASNNVSVVYCASNVMFGNAV